MKAVKRHQPKLGRLDVSEWVRLFDLLPDVSFFLKDRKGRFVALNPRGCEYCGVRSEADAIGRTDHDFFPRRRADEYRADDRSVMQSGRQIINRVESAPEAEGSPRLVVTSKIPLRNRAGRVIGLAGISRPVERTNPRSGAAARLAGAVERMHQGFGEPLTTSELAAKAGLSASQFDRVFRRAFGTSPRQYLLRVRVEAACRLLANTDQSIASVALACGFYDHAHLTRSFRQVMDATPTTYRRERQAPTVSR